MADATTPPQAAPKLGAITDLFRSERGLAFIGPLGLCGAFVFTGHMSIDQFVDTLKWLSGFYFPAKTLSSVVETYTEGRKTTAPADASALAARASIAAPAPQPPAVIVATPAVVQPAGAT